MVATKGTALNDHISHRGVAIGIAAIVIAVAAFYLTSPASDPAAFCAGAEKRAVLEAGLQGGNSKSTGDQIAVSMKHPTGIVPSLIKANMKTEVDDWIHVFTTEDAKQVSSSAYNTANDELNTWIVANCK